MKFNDSSLLRPIKIVGLSALIWISIPLTLAQVYLLFLLFFRLVGGGSAGPWSWYDRNVFNFVISSSCVMILATYLVTLLVHRKGGHAIAKIYHAKRIEDINPSMAATSLRRANEEVADAMGIFPPALYALPHQSLNAFTAGFNSKNTVLCITEGALATWDDEQLRAVVAHEHGHILSGDTRTNTHLVALTSSVLPFAFVGVLVIAIGSVCGAIGGREERSALFGVGVFLLFAVLGGLIILSTILAVVVTWRIVQAISRRQEHQADEMAVCCTGSSDALVSVLKQAEKSKGTKIGMSRCDILYSHMFFFPMKFAKGRTHPTIHARETAIKRLKATTQSNPLRLKLESLHPTQKEIQAVKKKARAAKPKRG